MRDYLNTPERHPLDTFPAEKSGGESVLLPRHFLIQGALRLGALSESGTLFGDLCSPLMWMNVIVRRAKSLDSRASLRPDMGSTSRRSRSSTGTCLGTAFGTRCRLFSQLSYLCIRTQTRHTSTLYARRRLVAANRRAIPGAATP